MKTTFVFEYFIGCNAVNEEVDSGLLCEAFAILRTLVEGLSSAGFRVITAVDQRVKWVARYIPADRILYVGSEGLDETLEEALKASEYAIFMAPESQGILADLVRYAMDYGVLTLNSDPDAIDVARSKLSIIELARKISASVPDTKMIDVGREEETLSEARRMGYPVVVKRLEGAGCEGLLLLKDEEELINALSRLRAGVAKGSKFLMQKYIVGRPASVSLLVSSSSSVPVALNAQFVELKASRSAYLGGFTPLQDPMKELAFECSTRLVDEIRGLRGYVGVDVVITSEDVYIMEVNPRPTTSIVGIQKAYKGNLLQDIVNAAVYDKLPKRFRMEGACYFSKVKLPITSETFRLINLTDTLMRLGEIFSPLFITKSGASLMVVSRGTDLLSAREKFKNCVLKLQGVLGYEGDRMGYRRSKYQAYISNI